MAINTVRGPVEPEDLGFTLSHEHLLCDLWAITRSYDGILDDEALAVAELQAYRNAGGQTVVDVTSGGMGRNPLALRRIAENTGLHIIMGAAWYREVVYPQFVQELDVNALADRIVEELIVGIDGTGIRAGVIGEIGTERKYITPTQERVFRAAARAQRLTGVPIVTHTTHFGELALEQIALLEEEGVLPERIAVSHLGDRYDFSNLKRIAACGVYMSVDNIGYVGNGYPEDSVRARNVVSLIRDGYLERVLLGGDVCLKSHLHAYGGKGYDHVLLRFLPLLRKHGITEAEIHVMTVANPARWLDVRARRETLEEVSQVRMKVQGDGLEH
jgi:predicted metal-dependent phosphotriesterase family hydrolase